MNPNFNIDIARDVIAFTVNTEDGPMQDYRDYFFIIAQAPNGRRWTLAETAAPGSVVADERFSEAQATLAGIDHDPATRPDLWLESQPCYGSEAWDTDAERELACFEADCYGEPRPKW